VMRAGDPSDRSASWHRGLVLLIQAPRLSDAVLSGLGTESLVAAAIHRASRPQRTLTSGRFPRGPTRRLGGDGRPDPGLARAAPWSRSSCCLGGRCWRGVCRRTMPGRALSARRRSLVAVLIAAGVVVPSSRAEVRGINR